MALAAGAVLVLTLATGRAPVVALGLTLSLGVCAYVKKSLPIGPNQSFFLDDRLPDDLGCLMIYTVSLVRRARLSKAAGAVPQPGPS